MTPLVASLFLALSVGAAPAAEPLTLERAVETALRSHPRAAEAAENVHVAEARVDQSLAGYYPQVNFAANATGSRAYYPTLADTKRAEVYSAAFTVKQTLFDFGRTAGVSQAARGSRSAASESLFLTRQDLVLRVKAAYYLLLSAEKEVAATAASLKARDELYAQAQAFFREGVRSKVDVAKAEANVHATRTLLLQVQGVRDLARVELANAMGFASLDDRDIADVPPTTAPPPAIDGLRQEAYENRGELRRLDALRTAGEGNLRAARGEYLPSLSAGASYGLSAGDLPPQRDIWSAGIELTVPIFSGYSSAAKEREAKASIRSLAAQHRDARLAVAKDVEAAWLAARDASARVVSTAKEAEAGQETEILTMERYHEGVGSVIDVTDAQAQALAARTANIRAAYDNLLALARLERAVGRTPENPPLGAKP